MDLTPIPERRWHTTEHHFIDSDQKHVCRNIWTLRKSKTFLLWHPRSWWWWWPFLNHKHRKKKKKKEKDKQRSWPPELKNIYRQIPGRATKPNQTTHRRVRRARGQALGRRRQCHGCLWLSGMERWDEGLSTSLSRRKAVRVSEWVS